MDTPERNQIATPLSKFEDSPVFNYINSLSPIKPVKSLHIAQTFQSLSFASIPSVFTSPHVSSHKESRFFARNNSSDPLKADFSSDDGDDSKVSLDVSGNVNLSDCLQAVEQGKCDIGVSIEEFNVKTVSERSKLSIRLPQALRYGDSLDCDTPRGDTSSYAIKTEMAREPTSFANISQDSLEAGSSSLENEVDMEGQGQMEQNKEKGPYCDWEILLSDAVDDVLIFSSSNESEKCQGEDQEMGRFVSTSDLVLHHAEDNVDDSQMSEPVGFLSQGHQECTTNYPGEVADGEQGETDHTPQLLPSVYQNKQDASQKIDEKTEDCLSHGFKVDTLQQRGMRRRCLVFELGGHKTNLKDDSKGESSNSMQSEGKPSDEKQEVTVKPRSGSSPCMLPGIGLHLNSLASTSKDLRIVKCETLTSSSRLISLPTSVGSFRSLTTKQKSLDLVPYNVQGDVGSAVNEDQHIQDAFQATTTETDEDLNQISPRKKRRKLENAGEGEACKRCNCKKSKCLKLYCECFAAGVYCVEPCSCHECFNKPIHEDTVLATRKQIESRNPLAFAPKVIRNSENVPETGEEGNSTPASARHKRGCNCKKSSCLKKYCECYQGGVGCSSNCRCEGCKNAFGRKSGYAPAGLDVELEEETSDGGEKDGLNKCQQIIEANKNEQSLESVLPIQTVLPMTPFQICRSSVNASFLSNGKPPRPSLVSGGSSSSSMKTCQLLKKSDFQRSQSTLEKHFQINPEDETPEILKGQSSPISGVKTTSPNRKRVSPPNREFGLSPSQGSSRKLILQSIPSFPSLTPHRNTNDFPV